MISEITEWLALHRVHHGEVTKRHGGYVRADQTMVGYLAEMFDALLERGLLTLDSPDRNGVQRLCLTDTGQTRYAALHGGRHNGQVADDHRAPPSPGWPGTS